MQHLPRHQFLNHGGNLQREEKNIISACNDEYDENEDDKDGLLSEELYGESSLQYIHHPNLSTLKKSGDKGCQFCYQVCYGALKDALLGKDNETSFEAIYLELDLNQITPPLNEQEYRGALMVVLGGRFWGHIRLRKKNGK